MFFLLIYRKQFYLLFCFFLKKRLMNVRLDWRIFFLHIYIVISRIQKVTWHSNCDLINFNDSCKFSIANYSNFVCWLLFRILCIYNFFSHPKKYLELVWFMENRLLELIYRVVSFWNLWIFHETDSEEWKKKNFNVLFLL